MRVRLWAVPMLLVGATELYRLYWLLLATYLWLMWLWPVRPALLGIPADGEPLVY